MDNSFARLFLFKENSSAMGDGDNDERWKLIGTMATAASENISKQRKEIGKRACVYMYIGHKYKYK